MTTYTGPKRRAQDTTWRGAISWFVDQWRPLLWIVTTTFTFVGLKLVWKPSEDLRELRSDVVEVKADQDTIRLMFRSYKTQVDDQLEQMRADDKINAAILDGLARERCLRMPERERLLTRLPCTGVPYLP